MRRFQLICTVLLIGLLAFLLYELLAAPELNIRLVLKAISKIISLILAYILVVFRLRRRDGNVPLSVYEEKFQDIIEDAFCTEPANRKRLLRGIRLFARQQYAAALKTFEWLEQHAVSSKDHEVLIHSQALCYEKLGNFEKATSLYEELLPYKPNNAAILVNLANLYQEANQEEHAIDLYKRAIACDPANGTTYHNLAFVCFKLNRPADALQYAKKALELDETLYLSEEIAALSCALLGDWEQSTVYYQACVQHKQDPKRLRSLLEEIKNRA